ncbi:hypothetical protein D9M70_294390 [compost metagenome]
MLEQQRDQVLDLLYLINALGVGELLQHRDAIAHFGESTLGGGELQGIDFVTRQLIPLFEGVPGQRHGVGQQQLDLLIDCSCHVYGSSWI